MENHIPTQPELVRSHQKDEDALDRLIGHCYDMLHTMYGPSVSLQWRREIKVVCYLTYLLLTTGSSRQTLGEEYTNIILYDPEKRKVPNTSKRVGIGVLQVIVPYLSTLLRIRWSNKSAHEDELDMERKEEEGEWDATPMAVRELFELFLRHLPAIHLSLFYAGGSFYHFSKRLLNVKYIRAVPGQTDPWSMRLYTCVGILLLLQTSWIMMREFHSIKKRIGYERKRRHKRSIALRSSLQTQWTSKCPLCLEVKFDPTVAPCGHTFCWECIVGHTMRQNEPSCPLCRQSAPANRLVYLVNYADD